MATDKPFTRYNYSCVVDHTISPSIIRDLDQRANKAFGQMIFFPPKEPERDFATGEIIPEPPKKISDKLLEIMKLPRYEPNDQIRTEIVFYEHSEQPSTISVNIIIPGEKCPPTMNHRVVGKELVVGFTAVASSISDLDDKCIEPLYYLDDEGREHVNRSKIPEIVKRAFKFNEIKFDIRVIKITFDNRNKKMKQRNLLNDHVWSGDAKRAVDALKEMVSMIEPFTVDFYVLVDRNKTLHPAFSAICNRLRYDRTHPSIWQRMHSKKLQLNDETVFFNIGSFKDKESRPKTETNSSNGYHDLMELCTRQAMCYVQRKEAREQSVRALSVIGGVIRPLELTGAGDASYLALLTINQVDASEAAKLNIRFDDGDVLKVNFKINPHEIVAEDNWDFEILKPFVWNLQGEIVGHLRRPRVPLPPNATEEEKKKGRAFVPLNLPHQKFSAHNLEDIRTAVDSSTPIRCMLTYTTSVKSESRIVAAMDILLNGSRPNLNKLDSSDPDRLHSASVTEWAQWLLMHDLRSDDRQDLLPEPISKKYLSDNLVDTDQVACLNYLYNCPVTFNGKRMAVIRGFPGSGKTSLLAKVVVAKLLGKPDIKMIIAAPSNQAVDVFVKRINQALDAARGKPEYAHLLQHRLAIRIHNDKTETRYVMSMADKSRLEKVVEIREAQEANDLEQDLAAIRAVYPDYDPNSDESIRENPVVSEDKGKGKEIDTSDTPASGAGPSTTPYKSPDSEDENIESDDDPDGEGATSVIGGLAGNVVSTRSRKSKKSKGPSKAQKKAAALAKDRIAQWKKRTDVNANYTAHDDERAITLDDDTYAGIGHNLTLYGGTLEGGVIDLASDKIPKEKLAAKASVSITDTVNKHLMPAEHGVRDERFKEYKLGIAQNTIDYARSHQTEGIFSEFLKKLDDYETQGSAMDKESRKGLDDAIKGAFAEMKKIAAIQGMTANNFGHSGNQLSQCDLLLIEEAGLLTVGELITTLANVDTPEVIGIGDENQLSPNVEIISPPGCTREAGMSFMQLLLNNHWEMAMLNFQRRGAPGLMKIPGILSYNNLIVDAPSTFSEERLVLAKKIRAFFNKEFPEYQSEEYFRYILIPSHGELRDELTGSCYNVDTAAVIINLQVKMVTAGLLAARDNVTITHYTAQQRLHDFALAQYDAEQPSLSMSDISNATTDEFQGADGECIWGDSVRTTLPGFTTNSGRNVVMQTRAKSAFINVGDTFHLQPANEKQSIPYMKRSFDEAKKLKACIYIDPNGPHGWLLRNKHVHPRVLGTDENVANIEAQQITEPVFDENLSDPAPVEQATFDASGPSSHWADDNSTPSKGASQSGGWGSGWPSENTNDTTPKLSYNQQKKHAKPEAWELANGSASGSQSTSVAPIHTNAAPVSTPAAPAQVNAAPVSAPVVPVPQPAPVAPTPTGAGGAQLADSATWNAYMASRPSQPAIRSSNADRVAARNARGGRGRGGNSNNYRGRGSH